MRAGRSRISRRYIYCRGKDEISEFAGALAQLPRFAESLLLRGIERALLKETYDAADLLAVGNNALRFSIMEATALALSRALGARGAYNQALVAVNKALAVEPYSIHLKAAKYTLPAEIPRASTVPPRYEKIRGRR